MVKCFVKIVCLAVNLEHCFRTFSWWIEMVQRPVPEIGLFFFSRVPWNLKKTHSTYFVLFSGWRGECGISTNPWRLSIELCGKRWEILQRKRYWRITILQFFFSYNDDYVHVTCLLCHMGNVNSKRKVQISLYFFDWPIINYLQCNCHFVKSIHVNNVLGFSPFAVYADVAVGRVSIRHMCCS